MARADETVMGGASPSMPVTHWTQVLSAGNPSNPLQREALDRLLETYWRPVYVYIRRAWHRDVEDAKDLTQAFFARLLEKESFATLDPARGSFRGYLKAALKHFLINAQDSAARRTPPGVLLRLDPSRPELESLAPPDPAESPERSYDRRWFLDLLDAAAQDLKGRLGDAGKKDYFEVFRILVLDAGQDVPSYQGVADRLGLRESDVRNYLHHCRGAFREILRRRIRETVDTDAEVDQEIAALLQL